MNLTQQQNNNQEFKLKINKIKNQIEVLTLDVDYLIEQKNFKQEILKILLKEKKQLKDNFLFQINKDKFIEQNQINKDKSIEFNQINKNKVKNIFRDLNQPINQYIKFLQQLNLTEHLKRKQNEEKYVSNSKVNKLQCQSLHLRQIFTKQEKISTHQIKISQLTQKRDLLYKIIHFNLQKQEPDLHQKILQRIKRYVQSHTRKKLIQEMNKLAKQNSEWMTHESNRVSNRLQEQKIEQISLSNLGLMKKIQAKKLSNNDWIFENFKDCQASTLNQTSFPVEQIQKQYKQVIKKMEEIKLNQQLNIIKDINKQKQADFSLKDQLTENWEELFCNKAYEDQTFTNVQQKMLDRILKIQKQIEKFSQ